VQSTVARLLERSERVARADIENPWGYLVGATRYAALDAIRAQKRRREVGIDAAPEQSAPEDPVAALIDRSATREAVVEALRRHIDAGDAIVVTVVTVWLDMADATGRAPSTREVATRAGVSHTRVALALREFRAAVAEVL
jgi:precorrin-6B methylase 2